MSPQNTSPPDQTRHGFPACPPDGSRHAVSRTCGTARGERGDGALRSGGNCYLLLHRDDDVHMLVDGAGDLIGARKGERQRSGVARVELDACDAIARVELSRTFGIWSARLVVPQAQ